MIDKDTILSVHDKKITLLQWLETVDKAIADAVLSSITVTRPDSAHLVIKFAFADGSIISSDPLAIGSTDLDTVYNMLSAGSNITLTKDTGNNRVVIAFNSGSNVTVGTLTASVINCGGNATINGTLTANGGAVVENGLGVVDSGLSVDEDVVIGGTAEITGKVTAHDDLTVDGDLQNDGFLMPSTTANQFDGGMTLNHNIEPSSGTVSFPFAHARVSNGKLSVVYCVKFTASATETITVNCSHYFLVPQAIANQLYPIVDNGYELALSKVSTYAVDADGQTSSYAEFVANGKIRKANATSRIIYVYCFAPNLSVTAGKSYAFRFEYNFLLS